MARNKYPSEENTRVVRINVGTYALLRELAAKHRLTMAEALDEFVTEQAEREKILVPPAQMPMAAFRVMPAPPVIAVNGAGVTHSAFKIRPKGVIIDD